MYVEFLGIPRERAGISELEIEADTLGELLRSLVARVPALGELVTANGLHPSIAANLNGDEFVCDPHTKFARNDRLLLLSADVGG
jgi:molybdopterin converting factor small subunit